MTGEKKMFSSYEKNQDPQRVITFGDGNQGLVKGLSKIAISPDHSISNVFLVDSLNYNLLFVSQERGQTKRAKDNPKAPWSGAPDRVRCTRALDAELATFGKMGGRSAIIHRIIR
jgi:hypothetical protein